MAKTSQLVIHTGIFTLLALSSLGLGSLVNLTREHSMGLYYRTPAQRLVDDGNEAHSENENPLHEEFTATENIRAKETVSLRKKIRIITLEGLIKLKEKEQAVVFDVRPNLFYQLAHIPGAYSFQIKAFDDDLKVHESRLASAMAAGKEIVLYCAGPHCPDASKVASKLSQMKYGNISVFEGGWEFWERAGLEKESDM